MDTVVQERGHLCRLLDQECDVEGKGLRFPIYQILGTSKQVGESPQQRAGLGERGTGDGESRKQKMTVRCDESPD